MAQQSAVVIKKPRAHWPEPPVIQKTFDYDDFNFKNNRDLDRGNLQKLRKLAQENRFYPWKAPILVDKHRVIKDGQHRFTICQEFGYPIYFIEDKDIISAEEVMDLNRAVKPHSVPDRINILKESNTELGAEVRRALGFWGTHAKSKDLSQTFIFQLLLNFNDGPAVGTALLDQTFKVKCEPETVKLLNWLDNLAKGPFKWEKPFISALLQIMKAAGDRELVYTRIKNNEGKITAEQNIQGYKTSLLEIFNFGRKSGNKLVLKKMPRIDEDSLNAN